MEYLNQPAFNHSAVTFDVDWAPDFAIELCAEICTKAKIPATFFATNQSDFLNALRTDSFFEIGIHPNFLTNTSHGRTQAEIMDHCLDLVPDARSIRTHALFQSSHLHHLILTRYPQIRFDVSLFLPMQAHLRPFPLFLEDQIPPLIRLPFFWEDDVASVTPGWHWNQIPESPGMKIFNFHPIHVALNMADFATYRRLKDSIDVPLWKMTRNQIEPFINRQGPGAMTFLQQLLQTVAKEGPKRICDLGSIELFKR